MNSTDARKKLTEPQDPAESARLIREFFDSELMPIAQRLRDAEQPPFPLCGNASQGTYYVTRRRTAMSPADFEVFGLSSIDDFEPALAQLWKQQGWSALAPGLGRLARALYFAEDRDQEISPFIYVMF